MAIEQQRTTVEQREALRIDANTLVDTEIWWTDHSEIERRVMDAFPALLADADALAAALAEVERYKTALLAVSRRIGPAYESLEGDGDGYAERMLSKMSETISAALTPAEGSGKEAT